MEILFNSNYYEEGPPVIIDPDPIEDPDRPITTRRGGEDSKEGIPGNDLPSFTPPGFVGCEDIYYKLQDIDVITDRLFNECYLPTPIPNPEEPDVIIKPQD
jgi:hypothetical protein